LRTEKKISQAELAEKMGTKQSVISRLEAGEYNPTIGFLSKLASSLGKKIEIKLYIFYSTDLGGTWHKTKVFGAVLDMAAKRDLVLAATTRGVMSLDIKRIHLSH
jgi:transcriptional regulator with XRE-family HTH domain